MINTRKMTLLELFHACNKPLNTATREEASDIFKAARVKERRRDDWLKANPELNIDDWLDTWYPGGHKAYDAVIREGQLKLAGY